jgi:glutamyl-tRNA reductase
MRKADAATPGEWARGQLMVVGLSYRTTSLEKREQLAPISERSEQTGTAQKPMPGVLLATCNRIELYSWVTGRRGRSAATLARAMAEAAGVPLATFESDLFTKSGPQALRHLVRVVSGLDSLVVGDVQIHGQARAALRLAIAANGLLPAPLNGVFERALEASRRIRRATAFGQRPSVASAAVALALGQRSPVPTGSEEPTAVVLGAGAVAREAVQALLAAGTRVIVLNRTKEHTRRLVANHATLVTGPLEFLPFVLPRATLLVCATAARQPIVDCAAVQAALVRRPGLPLVILDLAVPRAVEASTRDVPGVQVIDMDDLEHLCPIEGLQRSATVQRGEALALEETLRITRWMRVRAITPAIVELRRQGEEIRALELRRVARCLRDLSAEERAAVEVMTTAIVNQLLHGPTLALREAAAKSMAGGRRSQATVKQTLRLDRVRLPGNDSQ